MKILVDTSVWSLALRRSKGVDLEGVQKKYVNTLSDLVRDGRAVLTGAIRQELLSGIKLPAQFAALTSALTAFEDVAPSMQDYELAAQLFNMCRTMGVQGSNTDFLICALSINHRLPILSLDNNFVHYQKHLPIRLFAE